MQVTIARTCDNGCARTTVWCRYTGCPVSFAKGQLRGQATTDSNGAFSLPVAGATAADYTGGLVTLAAAAGAGNACTDALTGLPPPFSLGALVPAAAGEMERRLPTALKISAQLETGFCRRHGYKLPYLYACWGCVLGMSITQDTGLSIAHLRVCRVGAVLRG